MRIFLYLILSFIFTSVLSTVATVSMWQYWVILLIWIFGSWIDGLINLIAE